MHEQSKNLIFGLAISITLHGIILILSSVSSVPHSAQEIEVEFTMSATHHPDSGIVPQKIQIPEPVKPAVMPRPQEPDLPEQVLNAKAAPRQPLTHEEWVAHSSGFKLKKWSLENPLPATANPRMADSQLSRRLMPMGGPHYEKKTKGFSLFPEPGPAKPELDFIPSDVELDALCSVWQQDSITTRQIYTRLDTSLRVTVEDLNKALEHLTDKGLLNRRIISPQNKFKFFFLPEDRFGLELSPKNRRNREYEYSQNLDQRLMLDFLNARVYQVEHSQESASPGAQGTAEKIKAKVLHLLKKEKL